MTKEQYLLSEISKEPPWPQLAKLIFSYHLLKIRELGHGKAGRLRKGYARVEWSQRATAKAVKKSIGAVNQYLKLAANMDDDLASMSKTDALNYLKHRAWDFGDGE